MVHFGRFNGDVVRLRCSGNVSLVRRQRIKGENG